MNLLELLLHIDRSIAGLFQHWGWVAWALVFLVIFVETGVVIFPFLPGDSLLFACGAFATAQDQSIWLFYAILAVAALSGNSSNYAIGRGFGHLLLKPRPGKRLWVRPEHLEQTHRFFERWGGWSVTLSRFFPILRTITPFVAGVGRMPFGAFSWFNALGGLSWTAVFLAAGYFFGTLPWVQHNFSLVVIALVLIPALPALWTFLVKRSKKPNQRD